jgi:hypothetical protein
MNYGVWCNELRAFVIGIFQGWPIEYPDIPTAERAMAEQVAAEKHGRTYRVWPIVNGKPYYDGVDTNPSDAP